MPNRILKESITTSETIDQLSAEEERFFYRLLVVCDDYGRYDARPAIIIGHCFPLKIGQVTEKHVMAWLFSLQDAGLIWYYKVDGRPYLQVVTWDRHQQKRAQHSKFPPPNVSDYPEGVSAKLTKLTEYPRGVSAKGSMAPAGDGEQLLATEISSHQPPATPIKADLVSSDTAESPSDDLQSDASGCNQPTANVPVFEKRETRNEKRETRIDMSASAAAAASVGQVFDYYQKQIQPSCRYLDAARKKIQTRLKTFGVEELMQAVDRFRADPWWMDNNASRGAAWFFDSDTRIEQFINMTRPQGGRDNGQATGADRLGDHQGQPDRSVPPTGDYGLEERITF